VRLYFAAKNGDLDTVKELVKTTFVDTIESSGAWWWHDSKKHYEHDEVTPLLWAATRGHKYIVQILLDNGANINHQDNYGQTALLKAAYEGHKDIVQILLDNGANINHQRKKNNDGSTALMRAALGRNKDVVKLLLDKGANTRLKGNGGFTACDDNENVDNIIPSCD